MRQQRAEESALHARYLAAALRDCVLRGETPYASHGLLTLPSVLDDTKHEERVLGIRAGSAWREVAHVTAFYTDLGWSSGMQHGEEDAKRIANNPDCPSTLEVRHVLDYRILGPDWDRK